MVPGIDIQSRITVTLNLDPDTLGSQVQAAPLAELLGTLIFSTPNCSSSQSCGFEPGSSLAGVACETSQVLLAAGRIFFSWGSPIFAPLYD